MKASINEDGIIVLEPETPIEVFAMKTITSKWENSTDVKNSILIHCDMSASKDEIK